MIFAIHHQEELMSFRVGSFAEAPTLSSLMTLKRSDILALDNHYKLETISGMRKNEIQTVLIECFIDEEIVSGDKTVVAELISAVELKKLELRQREKKQED